MNKRIKKLWIKALRSGKYEQGKGSLRTLAAAGSPNDFAFCCLGVLCDLRAQATGRRWRDKDDTYLGDSCTLPEVVREWAGLDDEDDPRLGPRRNSKRAAAANDAGKSFSYIADRIEKYL